MKKASLFLSILIFLLVFHNETITGAQNGLLLWYQILIPSLLPFILVTNALSETNAYMYFATILYPIFKEKSYEIMVLILGNLCGYPIGGKIISSFIKGNIIEIERGNRILPLASSASPMFIIGYVYEHILNKKCPFFIFILSIYLPILLGYFLSLRKDNTKKKITNHTAKTQNHSITDTFMQSVKTMVFIGIYVMIFSVLFEIILPFCKPIKLQIPLSFLEITTGLNILSKSFRMISLYNPIVGALTAFGGLCSAFQISCVFDHKEMNIKKYLQHKFLLCAGTFTIILIYQELF